MSRFMNSIDGGFFSLVIMTSKCDDSLDKRVARFFRNSSVKSRLQATRITIKVKKAKRSCSDVGCANDALGLISGT